MLVNFFCNLGAAVNTSAVLVVTLLLQFDWHVGPEKTANTGAAGSCTTASSSSCDSPWETGLETAN
jgi:hypothetical protein